MTNALKQAVAARGINEKRAAADWRRRSRRVVGDRPKIWPHTKLTSLSLRGCRGVNADAQAMADLRSNALATSPDGISTYVAAWSLLNHLKIV